MSCRNIPDYPIIGETEHPPTKSIKIHGPPGSGKTTQLLLRLVELLQRGYSLCDVTFVTYHKELSRDILSRLYEYGFIDEDDLWSPTTGKTRYFGTIHGIANRISGGVFRSLESATAKHRQEFMQEVYSRPYSAPATRSDITPVGKLAFDCIDWLKKNQIPLSQPSRAPQYVEYRTNWRGGPTLEAFDAEWEEYRIEHGLFDFTDQLLFAHEEGLEPGTPVLIVDEAQDMYPLLFDLIKEWQQSAEVVIIAGDPHQTVNTHEGASPEFFKSIDLPTVVLPESHRVPENHWQLARQLLSRHHEPPELGVREVTDSVIKEVQSPRFGYKNGQWSTPSRRFSPPWLLDQYASDGDALFIARTRLQCQGIAWSLLEAGVLFRSQNGLFGWDTTVGESRTQLFNALQKIRGLTISEDETGYTLPEEIESTERKLSRKEARALFRAINSRCLRSREDTYKSTTKSIWSVLDNYQDEHISLQKLDRFLTKEFWVRYTRGPEAVEWLQGFFEHPREQVALRNALRRSNQPIASLEHTPRISTIHSAKGGQATSVICYDGVPPRVKRTLHRPGVQATEDLIWYVGLSRSLKDLIIVRGGFGWIVPYLPSNAVKAGEKNE